MTIDTILDAQPTRQLSIDDLLATIETEERDGASENNLPSGWMYQMNEKDTKRQFADVLADVVASYQRKFGSRPKMIWVNPTTGDGDRVSHDKRIGRGYLLLGPLPKTT